MSPLTSSGTCYVGERVDPVLSEALPKGYRLRRMDVINYSGHLRDTFDGVLRKSGHLLLEKAGSARIMAPISDVLAEGPLPAEWRFAADLPEGGLRRVLRQASDLRAFLDLGPVSWSTRRYALLDELEKTVAHVRVTASSTKNGWVQVSPLRGYDAEARHVEQRLESLGFVEAGGPEALIAALAQPPVYTSKPTLRLNPIVAIHETGCWIAHTFIGVARQNEEGTRQDWDTEFLHDYRVSLRRVRSMLSLFKGVFGEAENAALKTELGHIMKGTNRLRDLDVYLLDRADYYELIPASAHAGLEILFAAFEKERGDVWAATRDNLASEAYAEQMNRLSERFETGAVAKGPNAAVPTRSFATKAILKKYKRVAGIAAGIDAKTPDETVHELRIQCKKLRYLMEFFAPLYAEKRIKPLIKSLKSLQDVLGRFNDHSVQRASLEAFVAATSIRGKRRLKLAESVGALVATLYQLQLKARADVTGRIETFVNVDTARRFERLKESGAK